MLTSTVLFCSQHGTKSASIEEKDLHNKDGKNWKIFATFSRIFCPMLFFLVIYVDLQNSNLAKYGNGPTVATTPYGHSKKYG